MASLMPQGKQRYTDNNGNNLSGGKLYAFAAGTSTPLDTYSDQAGTTPNTHPVVLNARGEATIFWGASPYKAVLKDASDVEVWTQDNMYAQADQADIANFASVASGKGDALIGVKSPGTGSASRTQHAKNDESVSVMDFDGPDAHTRFIAALTYLDSQGGGKLIVNRGQEFTVSQTILKTVANNIEIVFEPGAKLIAATGLSDPVMDIHASETAVTDLTLKIVSPSIDCTAGSTTSPGQGCTAISAQYFRQLIVEDVDLYGGESRSNLNADSGITPIDCDIVKIDGGRIRGFSDGGVYIGGDNTAGATGDGITATIRGVLFERCNNAVLGKRDLNHLRVTGCHINECGSGVIAAEITTPNYTNPVRRLDVVGNYFHKINASAVRFRGPTKGKFCDNTIEDWGYDPDGVSNPAGANGYALTIQGSTGIEVKGNEFKMNAWTLNDQRAVLLDNVTLDAVVYNQGGHSFADNSYRTIPRIIVETAGGSASTYINETYDGITGTKFNSLHASSLVIFKESSKRGVWSRINGVEQPFGHAGIVADADGAVLTSSDSGTSYNNAGATAQATFTLPAAAVGLEFEFICMDTDGLKIQLTSGDILRTGSGNTTNDGSATATTVGAAIRIVALDSTNWVTKSITGTWTLA